MKTLPKVIGRVMTPTNMSVSQSSEPVNVLFHYKEELRLQMELRLVISQPYKKKIIPDYPSGSNVITRVLKNGQRRQRR